MDDTTPLDDSDVERIGWTKQRVLALLVVIPLAAFWVWAFSPWAPSRKADAVSDKTFLADAKVACATMQDALDELPPARSSTSAAARADVIAKSEPILTAMIAQLRADASTLQGRDAELVDQWLDDWEAYASDRQAYAVALRTDERALFIVSQRDGGQITKTMDGFSRVNDLKSCLVPTDV